MGSLRLSPIQHAKRGIPWLAIGVVAMPAAALIVCAFLFQDHPAAWSLLRAGLLIWATAAAFLLDDPPAPVVTATPRSPSWWHAARLLAALPLLAVPVLAASLWAINRPDIHVPGLAIITVAVALTVLAGSAVARRLGRNAPGELVAGSAILIVLFLLIRPVSIHGVPLLPWPGHPGWAATTRLWLILAAVAVLTIAIAGWWTRKPTRKRLATDPARPVAR